MSFSLSICCLYFFLAVVSSSMHCFILVLMSLFPYLYPNPVFFFLFLVSLFLLSVLLTLYTFSHLIYCSALLMLHLSPLLSVLVHFLWSLLSRVFPVILSLFLHLCPFAFLFPHLCPVLVSLFTLLHPSSFTIVLNHPPLPLLCPLNSSSPLVLVLYPLSAFSLYGNPPSLYYNMILFLSFFLFLVSTVFIFYFFPKLLLDFFLEHSSDPRLCPFPSSLAGLLYLCLCALAEHPCFLVCVVFNSSLS